MSMHKGLLGQSHGGSSVYGHKEDTTLGDYIARKQRQAAFEDVANEKYLAVINHQQFKEANSLVFEAELCLIDMGMSKKEARGWIMAWASGAGDGAE